jgi:hypothetical protein
MAARAILAEYGIGRQKEQKRATDYLDSLKNYNPDLHATLSPTIEAATARAEHLREEHPNAFPLDYLTMDELRSLADTVDALWEVSRRDKVAEIDGKREDVRRIDGKLTGRLRELGARPPEKGNVPGYNRAITNQEERRYDWQSLKAGLRRVEHWVDAMDGGNFNGLFRRYVWTPVSEAANRYRAQAAKNLRAYRDLVDSISQTLKPMKIDAKAELDYTFGYSNGGQGKGELLHALLHTGNASNKRKLLLGRGWASENPDGTLDTSRWDAFVARMIREGRITKADMDFCQGVWDLLDRPRPGRSGRIIRCSGPTSRKSRRRPFKRRGGRTAAATFRRWWISMRFRISACARKARR